MVKIYANLIVNGLKTLEDVPLRLREQVRQYLIEINFLPKEDSGSDLWN